jgi:hypothetical protein
MAAHASKVLMKVLYAARMARFDLLASRWSPCVLRVEMGPEL